MAMQTLFVCLLIAQSPPGGSDTTDLDRIRKALERQPTITTDTATDEDGRPVFRMSVKGPKVQTPLWDHWTNVPSYIRPYWRGYHFEFLEMVTKDEMRTMGDYGDDFRSATLYPVGVPVVPLTELLVKHVRAARRKSQEDHAREEVRKALADALACRADPSKPGC